MNKDALIEFLDEKIEEYGPKKDRITHSNHIDKKSHFSKLFNPVTQTTYLNDLGFKVEFLTDKEKNLKGGITTEFKYYSLWKDGPSSAIEERLLKKYMASKGAINICSRSSDSFLEFFEYDNISNYENNIEQLENFIKRKFEMQEAMMPKLNELEKAIETQRFELSKQMDLIVRKTLEIKRQERTHYIDVCN